MSIRSKKKKAMEQVNRNRHLEQLNDVVTIYDNTLDQIYRDLSRKTDKVEWIECDFKYLPFRERAGKNLSKSWLLPGDNNRKKTIDLQDDGSIKVTLDLIKGDGFYFQTGNIDINTPPINEKEWEIKSGKKYQIQIQANYGEVRPDCAVFILQYDSECRVSHKFQQVYNGLNKIDFITAPDANYISVAFRFKGVGDIHINKIKILAEESLNSDFSLHLSETEEGFKRIVELKNQTAIEAFKGRIGGIKDSSEVQLEQFEDIKNKLAIALYEKRVFEYSLPYRLGNVFSRVGSGDIREIIKLPKRLVKISAANRKGKFTQPQLDSKLKQTLLESVGIFDERVVKEEITWPPFEPRSKQRNQHINIVCITDKFTYECYRYEANFIPLSKKSWKEEIEEVSPTMFFIESAWNGNDGEWTYTMASYKKHLGDPLRDAIKYCQSKQIPVVFWNKEDPTNYDVFIDVASDCDYIFTTDGNIIDKYKSRVGHSRVYPLAFAAQPAIHNPIRDKRKQLPTYEVCFAGSWYNNGHDTRRVQTEIVLDGSMTRELHVYDRMLHAKKHRESRIFPSKYQPFIAGSLDYDQMVTAYRQYKVFLNINTVQDSPTMFSRRVFEILACATPVISTKSIGMIEHLGSNVAVVGDHQEASKQLSKFLDNDMYRRQQGHIAARHVLSNHSYSDRLDYIFQKIGVELPSVRFNPKVSVVMCSNRPHNIDIMIRNFLAQTYNNKELIVIINKDDVDFEHLKNKLEVVPSCQLIHEAEAHSLGECLNTGVKVSCGDVIAKFDDDDIYGENYLHDAVNAMDFSGADVVGKDSHFAYIESLDELVLIRDNKDNRYSDFIIGASLVIKKSVFDTISFHDRSKGEDSQFLRDCKEYGVSIYSSDMFNYITMRGRDLDNHTWKIEDSKFVKGARKIAKGMKKEIVNI